MRFLAVDRGKAVLSVHVLRLVPAFPVFEKQHLPLSVIVQSFPIVPVRNSGRNKSIDPILLCICWLPESAMRPFVCPTSGWKQSFSACLQPAGGICQTSPHNIDLFLYFAV